MLSVLYTHARDGARRFFERHRAAKVVTVAGFCAALLFAIGIMYALFSVGFIRVASEDYFAEALTLYVTELFLLVSFLLVFASALITGLFALFGGDGDALIVSSPSYRWKLRLASALVVLASLWPLVVVILPALAALSRVFGLTVAGFVVAFLASLFLVALTVFFALALLLGVAGFLDRYGTFSRGKTALLSGSAFLVILYVVWAQFRAVDLVTFFQARLIERNAPDLSPIIGQFSWFPSHAAALATHSALLGEFVSALLLVFALLILLLFALYTLSLFDGPKYLVLWQRSREGVSAAGLPALGSGMLVHARTASRAIFAKEAIVFLRNMRGMLRLGFILFIWAIQTASSHVLSRGLGAERVQDGDASEWISMLQFGVILYFVAMFGLRYAFPSFSAERRSAWLLGSAPVDLALVFRAKLAFFGVLFSALALIFTFISASTIGLALPSGGVLFAGVLVGAATITLFALSLGALFPNTETDDPEYLSTTLPGLGFIVGALAYGAYGAFAIGRLFTTADPLAFLAFLLISLAGGALLWRAAERALATRGYEY